MDIITGEKKGKRPTLETNKVFVVAVTFIKELCVSEISHFLFG